MFGGGDILVIFKSDASGTAPGFSIQVSVPPATDILKSAQPFTKTISRGGFTYFAMSGTQSGQSLVVSLTVNSFDGLQSPTLFMSKNAFPSLESYSYMNNSSPITGGRFSAILNIQNPTNSQYWIGVFLYGNNAQITMVATWAYNFPALLNGQKNSSSVVGTGAFNFQIFTPKLTKSLNFQISRQVPGGFPIAYIAQGYLPTLSQHGWVMDTTQQSYISLTIPSPNPTVNYNPNPGVYVISIIASAGPDAESDSTALSTVQTLSLVDAVKAADKTGEKKATLALSAGFILMATWA